MENGFGNLRTFKTIHKLYKLLELYKASHMLAIVAKSSLEVKVNKSSHQQAQLQWDQESKAAGARTLHISSMWGSWV